MISSGVFLNYTTSYLSPGGAAGGQIDRWNDGGPRSKEGGEGRGGPSRDGEPPTRTHRHELVCGEGPARSVLRVGARTQESGPPAPSSSPRNPGIQSQLFWHNLGPIPPPPKPGIQTPGPFRSRCTSYHRVRGPGPNPPSDSVLCQTQGSIPRPQTLGTTTGMSLKGGTLGRKLAFGVLEGEVLVCLGNLPSLLKPLKVSDPQT